MFLHSLIGSLPSSPGRHNSCLLHSIVVLITACFKLNCKKAKVPKDVSREKEKKIPARGYLLHVAKAGSGSSVCETFMKLYLYLRRANGLLF